MSQVSRYKKYKIYRGIFLMSRYAHVCNSTKPALSNEKSAYSGSMAQRERETETDRERVAAELTTCVCCCSRSFVNSDIHPKCLQWTKHLLVTPPWQNSAWHYASLWPARVEPSPSPSLHAPASSSPWNPTELPSLLKR